MSGSQREIKNRIKVRIVVLMLIACVFCVCLVGANAYASKIRYEINAINRQITAAQRDIKNLEVKIKTAANITNLEDRALALGLIYPEYTDITYLRAEAEKPVMDLALALKEKVYR